MHEHMPELLQLLEHLSVWVTLRVPCHPKLAYECRRAKGGGPDFSPTWNSLTNWMRQIEDFQTAA